MKGWMLGAVGLIVPFVVGTDVEADTVDWVTVGGVGNAADDTSFGAVGYSYRIRKFEVENSEYAKFLNAVAATDPHGLYNSRMGSSRHGGITRRGTSGAYRYVTKPEMDDAPVNFVSFWDSLRFANWLEHGRSTGAPDNATTEDGAYTIPPAGTAANLIARNSGASIFLADVDEWYKAAYYDAVSMSYFEFPAGSDTPTSCSAPGNTPNSANCGGAVGTVTEVGEYHNAASPAGTFDQGGNVFEWVESSSGRLPRILGGGWDGSDRRSDLHEGDLGNAALSSAFSGFGAGVLESAVIGIRVVSVVPEPSTGVLLACGLVGLCIMGRPRV